MANFNSAFLQNRQRILGNNQATSSGQIVSNQAFQANRKKVISKSIQPVSKVKQQVIIPKKPIKKDEPGGLFDIVGNIAETTLKLGGEAKDAIIKHFKEKAPITALIQGNPGEFVARTKATLEEYERQYKEDPISFTMNFSPMGLGTIGGKTATSFTTKNIGKFSSLADMQTKFEIPDNLMKLKPSGLNKLTKGALMKLGEIIDHPELFKNYPELKEILVNKTDAEGILGSLSGKRMELNLEIMTKKGWDIGTDKPFKEIQTKKLKETILHEIQHGIQQKEGFASGGTPGNYLIPSSERANIQDLFNKQWDYVSKLKRGTKEWNLANDELQKLAKLLDRPEQQYKRLAGEIEANAVASRRIATPKQRMTLDPYASQGIPLKDQIVRFDNGVSASANPSLPKQAGIEAGIPKPPSQPPLPPVDPVQKIINALKEAKPLRGKQEGLYSKERAKRVARVASAGQRIPGEQGYFAQLGQLKGELPKVQFESIRKSFQQTDVDELFNMVEKAPLLTFEKVTTKGGLAKLLGAEGGTVPTRNEIELLRQVFPEEMIKEILGKRPLSEKVLQGIGEVLNVPRSLMASFDLSAPLRQGIFFAGKPKQFAPAFKEMFKYAFSQKAYQGLIDNIKLRPSYKLMRQGNLALTDIGSTKLTGREEVFMSNLAEKIPGMGKIVRGSNRAYTGFLNKLRADVFDDIIKKADTIGIEKSDRLIHDTARFINAATGRGELPKSIERAAVALNATFFSPRLMASRLNLLNPIFYVTLDSFVRKEAVKSLLTFGGVAGTVLGLAKLGGAEVGADPRSADFGKIKIDNTRYDILGGFQQYIKLASQLATGKIISSTSGREITLGEGYKPLTQKDIILRFFESKESPIASFVTGWLQGQTATGKDFDIPTEVINRFIPMVTQDMYDLYQEGGLEELVGGLPAPFGVGVQTYGKQELVYGESKIGEPTAQIRPVSDLAEAIREKVLGKQPLGSSKSFDVETYYDQLNNLTRKEASDVFKKIRKTNPDLAKQILDVSRDREKGITPHDKDLKSKGVASGDRVIAIKKDFDKLKTKEEKSKLWKEYVKKGIITKEVSRQLYKLLSK